MMTMNSDLALVDLHKLDFFFAIQKPDVRVATIKAYHTHWSLSDGKTTHEIELIDCNLYLHDDKYSRLLNPPQKTLVNDNLTRLLNKKLSFLCPYKMDHMRVQGGYGSQDFDYVKIAVYGCDIGDECMNDEEISKTTINFLSLRALPSLIDDENKKGDQDDVIVYSTDLSYFKFIDPTRSQASNIFFA